VNIDEEMTDMVGQQRAYDAAARLVKTIDEMLQTLIQM
jgi:flagellar hook-associated protein 1 FlgK